MSILGRRRKLSVQLNLLVDIQYCQCKKFMVLVLSQCDKYIPQFLLFRWTLGSITSRCSENEPALETRPDRVAAITNIVFFLAYEQALRSTLAVGREKEGDLATTSLEFDYLHRKKRCEMLFSGDDTSNGFITPGTYFSMFVYIRARFRFALIGGNLTVDGEPQGNWRRNSNSRNVVASSLSFSRPAARAPWRACS